MPTNDPCINDPTLALAYVLARAEAKLDRYLANLKGTTYAVPNEAH